MAVESLTAISIYKGHVTLTEFSNVTSMGKNLNFNQVCGHV